MGFGGNDIWHFKTWLLKIFLHEPPHFLSSLIQWSYAEDAVKKLGDVGDIRWKHAGFLKHCMEQSPPPPTWDCDVIWARNKSLLCFKPPNLVLRLSQYLLLITIKIHLRFVPQYYYAEKCLTWKQWMLQPNAPVSFCPINNIFPLLIPSWITGGC